MLVIGSLTNGIVSAERMDLNNLGSIASIVGLIITFGGFIITIRNVKKSKELTIQIKKKLSQTDAITHLTRTESLMEDIKIRHQRREWTDLLIYKYNEVRRSLVQVKMSYQQNLNENSLKRLSASITTFRDLEIEVQTIIQENIKDYEVSNLNRRVNIVMDDINKIIAIIRDELAR